ncbi:hypothetical protein EDC04DRAFT_2599626 [Pisolithus marmoratus]|nr:hypothetical protein EDC04DRAFT_2599626 [Pisolithus marmoratus]
MKGVEISQKTKGLGKMATSGEKVEEIVRASRLPVVMAMSATSVKVSLGNFGSQIKISWLLVFTWLPHHMNQPMSSCYGASLAGEVGPDFAAADFAGRCLGGGTFCPPDGAEVPDVADWQYDDEVLDMGIPPINTTSVCKLKDSMSAMPSVKSCLMELGVNLLASVVPPGAIVKDLLNVCFDLVGEEIHVFKFAFTAFMHTTGEEVVIDRKLPMTFHCTNI